MSFFSEEEEEEVLVDIHKSQLNKFLSGKTSGGGGGKKGSKGRVRHRVFIKYCVGFVRRK